MRQGDGHEGELSSAKALIREVPLCGLVVTGDGLNAQKEVCALLQQKGADYLFRVRDNQPTLLYNLAVLFADAQRKSTSYTETDGHADRTEVRTLEVSAQISDYLQNEWGWPGIAQVALLTRVVTQKGRTTTVREGLITSLMEEKASPKQLLQIARGHWGIENRLHWVRDVTFDEDRSQVRTGAAPQVMAALRNTAIGLLRKAGHANLAAALRRHAAHPNEALRLVGIPIA